LSKTTLIQAGWILLITLLAGIFFNLSNPNRIQFIGDEKTVDYSQSDSLLNALRVQDSILKAADLLKLNSDRRNDSLALLNEQRVKDSTANADKLDSIKHVQDSLKTLKQKTEDSLKNLQNQVTEISKPVDIKLDFAKALFDKKYKFIDARDIADYDAGHIRGAINIPYHEFDKYKDRLSSLPKDQVYVTYCSSACDVSIDMAYAMAKMGFKKLYIFHGGWDEWKNAGFPAN
jgi:rhodanese-related sulfurtransferase